METNYQKILDFMIESGKRLKARAGNIADIGVSKRNLTEEDFAIEQGFKKIITGFGDDHTIFAEEENDVFKNSKHVWVVDPISGTGTFIKGLPHYAIVITHLVDQKAVFAAVYDPSADELFTAYKGKGAFLNGKPIAVPKSGHEKVFLWISSQWKDSELVQKIRVKMGSSDIGSNTHSMAINYSWVACGRWDGIISLTKDSFPEFAGNLIVREAGGQFTTFEGAADILPTDRKFVIGNPEAYEKLYGSAVYLSSWNKS